MEVLFCPCGSWGELYEYEQTWVFYVDSPSLELGTWLTGLLPKINQHVFSHYSLSSTSASFPLPVVMQSHFFCLPKSHVSTGVNVGVYALFIPSVLVIARRMRNKKSFYSPPLFHSPVPLPTSTSLSWLLPRFVCVCVWTIFYRLYCHTVYGSLDIKKL